MWIILTPILLFTTIMILLYVPPVQNLIRKQVNKHVSKAIGMELNVGRIDLRFPLNLLVRDVEVVQKQDTLLNLGSLNVRVQLMPLFKGTIDVDRVALDQVKVNSADLIEGIQIKGELGHFFLQSHAINLSAETALINRVELTDTDISLILRDTTTAEKPDTASAPVNWRFDVRALQVKNVGFEMETPADTTTMAAKLGDLLVSDVTVDLKNEAYELRKLLLEKGGFKLTTGTAKPAVGFDPSHLSLNNIKIDIDSVRYHGRDINAIIKECSMYDRSGLSVSSLTARVQSDSTMIRVPYVRLSTPHSQINLTAQTYWELVNIPTTGRLSARFNAQIGKQDVMLFAGDLPEEFKEAYPFRPLVVQAGTEGNLKQMQISRIRVDLPGAFSIDGGGELYNLTDSVKRSINVDLDMQTQDLDFLTTLAGMQPGDPLIIPDSMSLQAKVTLEGSQLDANLTLKEGIGSLTAYAGLNFNSEIYNANLRINNIQVNHFLPKDSIYGVTASLDAFGQGLNPTLPKSKAQLKASVNKLEIGKLDISGVSVDGTVKNGLANATIVSDNTLLRMKADAQYNLASSYPEGKVEVDATHVGLYQLGLLTEPLKHDFAFHLVGAIHRDSIDVDFSSGDLKLEFGSNTGLNALIKQSTGMADELISQLSDHSLEIDKLRQLLPNVYLNVSAGKNNVLAWFLDNQKMSYQDIAVNLTINDDTGINGDLAIHTFKLDTLQLDTIYFDIRQDTNCVAFNGGVINGPENPHVAFKTNLNAQLCNNDVQLMLEFKDAKDQTGVLFGVNARPLYGGNGQGDGVVFTLLPQEPILAFHKFQFVDKSNWVYLHKNKRVYANVNMNDAQGVGIRIQSLPTDTVSLQNIDVELRRIQLAEVFSVIPFMPDITGLFSLEAHLVQTEETLQLSAETTIDSLTYEKQSVGNIKVGASWLPGENGKQFVSVYLGHNGNEVLNADGALYPTIHKKDSIVVNTALTHFPTDIANVFLPSELATLSGDIDGDVHIRGFMDAPIISGSIVMDTVSVKSAQYGAQFTLGNQPIVIKDSRLQLNNFSIYTTSNNPFTINGYLDFRDFAKPIANLKLKATNYELLNAKRTKQSMVYGKAYLDMDATIKGPLSELQMRGGVALLGNTDVTYVLTDSPLTVQDRLSGLVTFTSFNDTVAIDKSNEPAVSFGGLDLVMGIQIDPTVQFNVDLSADQSSRVQVQGGGNLSFKYTPQGTMSLTGRYTLTSGQLKITLPVIPLKGFEITNGSYVEWTGNPMDPTLNITASEKVRASVGMDNGASQMVNFIISIVVKNRLDNLSLAFEISAPDNGEVQNQLASMGPDERSKQAVAMLVSGIYLADSGSSGGFNMGSALNSVLSSQINSLMGNVKNANLSVGVENNTSDVGGKQTDYSFSYSQRFFNDRFQVVIGGKVSTGADVTYSAESFINNISLEYRLDESATRYIRVFYDKNYESILDGEVTEGGVGLVLRKKLDKLSELFIFKRKKKDKKEDKKEYEDNNDKKKDDENE